MQFFHIIFPIITECLNSLMLAFFNFPFSLCLGLDPFRCALFIEKACTLLLWRSQAYLLEPEFWWLVEYTFCITLFDSSWQLLSVHIKVNHRQYVNGRFIHSKIYVAPLQGNYTEVLLTPAWPKWTVIECVRGWHRKQAQLKREAYRYKERPHVQGFC